MLNTMRVVVHNKPCPVSIIQQVERPKISPNGIIVRGDIHAPPESNSCLTVLTCSYHHLDGWDMIDIIIMHAHVRTLMHTVRHRQDPETSFGASELLK
jgi:hypothetical protein